MGKPSKGRNRVVIEHIEPEIDCGRFPIKRIVGETVRVRADVFADGHEGVRARLLWKREGETDWRWIEMSPLGNDRWQGEFPTEHMGRYAYTVAGEIDRFETWRSDLKKRIAEGQDLQAPDLGSALQTGAAILQHAASLAKGEDAGKLKRWAQGLKRQNGDLATVQVALADKILDEIAQTVKRYPDLGRETRHTPECQVVADRERAGFSAWYELFPRSWSNIPGKHGTLKDVRDHLEYVAEMGFDVLYLPPLHPIGHSFRKGKNNSPEAAPGEVGSPWAIGSGEGGHTSIDPQLGDMDDFLVLIERAREFGLEIALDIAFQTSPDHPWVAEHPEFFKKRPDGSIQYAENPPKKYQDIYPLDFESSAWRELWNELKAVFSFWIAHGVKIFRVDNPHTKAFAFWEWVIGELKAEHPEVLLLAEAFTRPRVMERLAKLGFSQSYTYFTWRNTKEELTEYMRELTAGPMREYLRPNFWPNTPDILSQILQTGGLPAFRSRLVLAATLGANYGIYGPAFELGENRPAKPGSEEYLNSEKYEVRRWDLNSPASLKPLIATLNRARRGHRALQSNHNLHFHETGNASLLCYSKRTADGGSTILAVVNLDPFEMQAGWTDLDLDALGLCGWDEPFEVRDLLTDRIYLWQGSRNYVELRPAEVPAHLFEVRKRKSWAGRSELGRND